jgi:hypothetical protein
VVVCFGRLLLLICYKQLKRYNHGWCTEHIGLVLSEKMAKKSSNPIDAHRELSVLIAEV